MSAGTGTAVLRSTSKSVGKCPVVETEEQELVAQVQQGDRAAFEKLWSQHKQRVYATIHGLLRGSPAAEDVAQETWTKAYVKIKQFNGRSKFSTWLHPIAVRKCLDHLKNKHTRHLVSVEDSQQGAQVPADSSGWSSLDVFSDYLARLREKAYCDAALGVATKVLEAMEEQKVKVILLFVYEDYTTTQVAAICGAKESWVQEVVKVFRRKCRQARENLSISERQPPAGRKSK